MGEWFYFGCGPDVNGHYLYEPGGQKLRRYGRAGPDYQRMTFDGMLAPQPESNNLYKASLTRLGGWNMSALAWWDRSADTRPASNSIIFAPSLTIEPSDILDQAYGKFPWVFKRLPQPIALWSPTPAAQPPERP